MPLCTCVHCSEPTCYDHQYGLARTDSSPMKAKQGKRVVYVNAARGGKDHSGDMAELKKLHAQASDIGLVSALPAIDAALAAK